MALKEDILNKTKSILEEKFIPEEVSYVPDINNSKLTFGCTGLKFIASVLYIDMRESTKLLNSHLKTTVAKIHMMYFHALVKIAKLNKGEVRSFNGDSLLVFFEGNDILSINNAVRTALQIKYALTEIINNKIERFSTINFGIGIDHGEILCTKIGTGGEDNKDLIWLGNAVNKATVLSDKSKSPNNIGISSLIYNNLIVDYQYKNWTSFEFKYNSVDEIMYKTNSQIEIN